MTISDWTSPRIWSSVSQSGTGGLGGWQQASLSCCGIDGILGIVLLLGGREPLEKRVDDGAQAQQPG
ncbi:MAG: hypothetical protein OXC19_09945 [Bryobacterales bacterium]|nr:hypothetical protein [Bryobacterales bacterium]